MIALLWSIDNLRELPITSSPDGLIDHALVAEIMPFSRWGLFQPGTPGWVFPMVFSLSCFLALLLIAGVRPRASAALLYVCAVSTYRWNFVVTYVEDAFVHQLLLWCVLLPTGTTLTLRGLLEHRGRSWSVWRAIDVPGAGLNCFALSMVLLYAVAGGWKWTSPLWQSGDALWSVLNLPIAHSPESWGAGDLSLLRYCTWAALVIEVPLALLYVLPVSAKWLKRGLLLAALGLHVGIIATMRLPLANLGCLAALLVAFRWEVVGRMPVPAAPSAPLGWQGKAAIALVSLMTLAGLRGVPGVGRVHEPAYAGLWAAGVVLEYRLFDWIDLANVHVAYDVAHKPPEGPAVQVDPGEVFPSGNRSMLLQAYLHNVVWMPIPAEDRERFKSSLYERIARRFAARAGDGVVFINATRQRITPDNRFLDHGSRATLFAFRVDDGVVTMLKQDLRRARPRNRSTK